MPRVTLICKNCGKPYAACKTENWGVWRWQDVACSKECGLEYVRKVEEARKTKTSQTDKP